MVRLLELSRPKAGCSTCAAGSPPLTCMQSETGSPFREPQEVLLETSRRRQGHATLEASMSKGEVLGWQLAALWMGLGLGNGGVDPNTATRWAPGQGLPLLSAPTSQQQPWGGLWHGLLSGTQHC